MVELGDEIRASEVDEAARRDRQERHGERTDLGADHGHGQDPAERGQAAQEVVAEGAPDREAAVDEDAEVTELLRDLVEGPSLLDAIDARIASLQTLRRACSQPAPRPVAPTAMRA